MPDDLYHHDILTWSERQADLLRRFARGEGVNGIDWDHVAEEIEDVGLSELHAIQNHLALIFVHLLKIHLSPGGPALGHWRSEIVAFQKNAKHRFAPSMRQRIDIAALYGDAIEQIEALGLTGQPPVASPSGCPFSLDELLHERWDRLEARMAATSPAP